MRLGPGVTTELLLRLHAAGTALDEAPPFPTDQQEKQRERQISMHRWTLLVFAGSTLADRTRQLREDIGVAAHDLDRANHDYQYHRELDGILYDVLLCTCRLQALGMKEAMPIGRETLPATAAIVRSCFIQWDDPGGQLASRGRSLMYSFNSEKGL
jgi:hypothetical protein